ncbi:trans-2-enoyl-CoA reductase [Psychromonas sp. CNPT3]|uniref:enoyl-ACP reductase FabV n=1 Tax=Psychromonas sp. CNPT3 TaxID=314282 RepID=UPI00006E78B9|nr:enoyl-ACP reductase FabV [Psychromonas sp. CNPT3]AGH82080.1 trans-2-enoyl-CoA reductase [Psychromonas sp. CNPT3]
MIIKPKIRGFICTTTHPLGCAKNVQAQIEYTKQQGKIKNGPKRVLIIGSSAGYGMSTRIAAAYGSDASTIGVFFEKPATERKTGSAGWYNSAAFEKQAHQDGLYAKSINGDAFSHAMKDKVIALIKEDLGQIDAIIYSVAAPVRKMPDTGEVIRSSLKPIGEVYVSTAIDTNKDIIIEAQVEPASEEEIANTVTVMGGEDWELWLSALGDAGVLAAGVKTVAYSYIGTELTWPIYWDGALGKAKIDLDRASTAIQAQLAPLQGEAYVSVQKSVVTQASSAIPVMPLYISMVFKIMKEKGLHEGCMEQIHRLFTTQLYREDNAPVTTDSARRLRLDDWELREDVQAQCTKLWPSICTENLFELTDYKEYKEEFLRLFGFAIEGIDYSLDTDTLVDFDCLSI